MATEHYTYRDPQHGDYLRFEAHRRPGGGGGGSAFDTTRNYPFDTTSSSSTNYSSLSASKVVAVLTLLPLGGTLLVLSGLTLAATVIGLAIASPLFVIFSPVLVPAALAIVLAVAGFIASGAFGVTAVSALTWMAQYVRRVVWEVAPEARDELEYLKRRGQETVDYIGQRTKDAGQAIRDKAHDMDRDVDMGARGQYEGAKGGRDRERETVTTKTHETTKTQEGGKNK